MFYELNVYSMWQNATITSLDAHFHKIRRPLPMYYLIIGMGEGIDFEFATQVGFLSQIHP